MKKLTAMLLALTLCFGLAACGGNTAQDDTKDESQTFHSRQILQLNISRILLLYILFYISIFIRLCKTDSGTA